MLKKLALSVLVAAAVTTAGCAGGSSESQDNATLDPVALEQAALAKNGFSDSDVALVVAHLAQEFPDLEQIRQRNDAASIGINARDMRKADEQAVFNRTAFAQQLLRGLRQYDSAKLRYVTQTGSSMESSSATRHGVSGSKKSSGGQGSHALSSLARTATYTLSVTVSRAPVQENGAAAQEYLFSLSESTTGRLIWERPFLLNAPAAR